MDISYPLLDGLAPSVYFVLVNSSVNHPKQKSASHPDPCTYTHTHTHTPQFSGSLGILSHEFLLTCLLASSSPLAPSGHHLVQTHPPLTWTMKIVPPSLSIHQVFATREIILKGQHDHISLLFKIFLVFAIAFRMKNKLQPNIEYLLRSGPFLLRKPHLSSIPSSS